MNGLLNVKTLKKQSLELQHIETLQTEISNSICTKHYVDYLRNL